MCIRDSSNPVLFYNADLLREAGLSEDGPQNWDEFVSFAKTVKEKTGKYGAYLQEGDTWVLQAVLESGGASMLTRDGDTATATFNSEKGKAAMQSYACLLYTSLPGERAGAEAPDPAWNRNSPAERGDLKDVRYEVLPWGSFPNIGVLDD